MPEPLSYDFTPNFVGGVNSYFPANRIGNQFLTKAQNCLANEAGVLTRRAGLTQIGSLTMASGPQNVMFLYVAGQGSQRKIYFAYRTNLLAQILHAYNGSTWLAPQTFTGTDGVVGDATWFKNSSNTELLYVCSSSSTGGEVNTASITATGTPPSMVNLGDTNTDPPQQMTTLFSAFNRVFALGHLGTEREALYYSASAPNIQLWDRTKNKYQFFTKDGQGIVGGAPFRENMIFVGMTNSVWALSVGIGASTLDLQDQIISNDIGLGGPKSISNVAEDLVFIDQRGELRSLGAIAGNIGNVIDSSSLSIPIKDQTDLIDFNELRNSGITAFFDGNIWMAFQQTDGSTPVYNFDTRLRSWFGPHVFKDDAGTTLKIRAFAVSNGDPGTDVTDGTDNHFYMVGDNGAANATAYQIYEYDSSVVADDGTVIDAEAITKSDDMGSPMQDKQFRHGEVIFKKVAGTTGRFDLHARVDMELIWTKVLEVDYNTGDEDIQRRPFSLSGLKRGRELQFKITSSDANTNFQITRLVVTFHPYRLESA